MMGPKKQDFGQESTYSKDFFFKSNDELWFIKKCQNCTFKVNFRCQKSTEFFQKKLRLRPNILSKRLGGRSLSRLLKKLQLRPINQLICRPLYCWVVEKILQL